MTQISQMPGRPIMCKQVNHETDSQIRVVTHIYFFPLVVSDVCMCTQICCPVNHECECLYEAFESNQHQHVCCYGQVTALHDTSAWVCAARDHDDSKGWLTSSSGRSTIKVAVLAFGECCVESSPLPMHSCASSSSYSSSC